MRFSSEVGHFFRDIECGFNGRVNLQLGIVTYFV